MTCTQLPQLNQSSQMWSPQRYLALGKAKKISSGILNEALKQIRRLQSHTPPLPVIFSLAHLARLSETDHHALRAVVGREREDTYRRFYIKKRSGGYRRISVPIDQLRRVQYWIAHNVLATPQVHGASHAFRCGNSIVKCAAVHENSRWVIKIDIADFFGSITEIQAYRVFHALGYNPLVSFEMARICTDKLLNSAKYDLASWRVWRRNYEISAYVQQKLGRLPQGAPTSPMLSNLVMLDVDAEIFKIARDWNLRYTRYSDDMTFSTDSNFSRAQASEFVSIVAKTLKKNGFYLNNGKTRIIPPGARKVVLGLITDGALPNLTKEFKDKIRQHLFYIEKFGIENHVARRDFDSIGGLYRHLLGLINYANMVDSVYAEKIRKQFEEISWPGI